MEEKRDRPSVVDGQLRSDDENRCGRGSTEEVDGEGERQNWPQTRARSRRDALERRCANNRETLGGIAWMATMATMELVATRKYPNGDMFFRPEHTELLRAKGLAAMR